MPPLPPSDDEGEGGPPPLPLYSPPKDEYAPGDSLWQEYSQGPCEQPQAAPAAYQQQQQSDIPPWLQDRQQPQQAAMLHPGMAAHPTHSAPILAGDMAPGQQGMMMLHPQHHHAQFLLHQQQQMAVQQQAQFQQWQMQQQHGQVPGQPWG